MVRAVLALVLLGYLYGLAGYHVADAATGLRIATIFEGYSATGPPVPAGTVCVKYPSYIASDCQGAARNIGLVGPPTRSRDSSPPRSDGWTAHMS